MMTERMIPFIKLRAFAIVVFLAFVVWKQMWLLVGLGLVLLVVSLFQLRSALKHVDEQQRHPREG
ncbi:hypothetical protein ACFSSC_03460 [Corynebacterium mendelii]|uniref:Uncharacterized protein n=1 Tax=Corynebacterium mendelii TaxID=2765362 RepID=A0A939DYF6_9CORY|nr:hypothetical protein [Corynebacterium mendelii]MBN9643539.1 hypothetical protein [Corynebacterium mendelii]